MKIKYIFLLSFLLHASGAFAQSNDNLKKGNITYKREMMSDGEPCYCFRLHQSEINDSIACALDMLDSVIRTVDSSLQNRVLWINIFTCNLDLSFDSTIGIKRANNIIGYLHKNHNYPINYFLLKDMGFFSHTCSVNGVTFTIAWKRD